MLRLTENQRQIDLIKAPDKTTCLIIDDNKEDRDTLAKAIHELFPSVKCYQASNCYVALLQFAYFIPAVIFLNLNMSQMNGMACLKQLRSMAALDNTEIVVLAESENPSDAAEAMFFGANDFKRKQSDFDSLSKILSLYFEQGKE